MAFVVKKNVVISQVWPSERLYFGTFSNLNNNSMHFWRSFSFHWLAYPFLGWFVSHSFVIDEFLFIKESTLQDPTIQTLFWTLKHKLGFQLFHCGYANPMACFTSFGKFKSPLAPVLFEQKRWKNGEKRKASKRFAAATVLIWKYRYRFENFTKGYKT